MAHTTRILACLALVLLVGGTAAQGQVDPTCYGDDTFLIHFESGQPWVDATVNVPFMVYYCLVNPTASCVDGWEARIETPTAATYFKLSESFPVNAINVGASPDYVVGFAQPLPAADVVVLMTQQVMVLASDTYNTYVDLTTFPSIPGNLAYVCNDVLVPMFPASGDFAVPMASINGTPLDFCGQLPGLDMAVEIIFDGDSGNTAGTSLGATDGYDPDYDIVDNDLSLTFPHTDWPGDYYRSDIKAAYDPTQELRQWTFTATAQATQSDGRYVAMEFLPDFAPTPDYECELYDRTSGTTHDLFADPTLNFYVPYGTNFSRTFDLFIGREVVTNPSLWVEVQATAGGLTESPNRLATSSLATDGYDAGLDIPEPAPAPANYVNASFIHADWPLGPRFLTDVKGLFDPVGDSRTWSLQVETDRVGQVLLDFSAGFGAGDGIGLRLHDRQTGQTFDLFPGLIYSFFANGTSSYSFDITVGSSGPPPFAPTSRYMPTGWSLVGFPVQPAGRTLGDMIWNQAPGYAYMFGQVPGAGYALLDPADSATQTQGYWFGNTQAFAWTATGDLALNGVTRTLSPGWNLVGYPMWFPGPFEGMVVVSGGTEIPWIEAIAQGLVATGVQAYNDGSGGYIDAVNLDPWHGYWIAALQPGLELQFKWQNFQVIPARLSAAKSALPVDEHAWSIDLTLWDANRRQASITLGIDGNATAGFDPQYDMPTPPAPPGGGPVLAFTRPEWNVPSGDRFSRDVMPLQEGPVTWPVVVATEAPGQATLRWDSKAWPKNIDFQLYLPTENRVAVMSMRDTDHLVLQLGEDPLPIVVRTPDMVTGVGDIPGLAYRLSAYPNPFNPMTKIRFELPREGQAEVRIFSVRGELIDVLGGEHYPAGTQDVTWQGRDRSGRSVPSGSYFAKLYVGGRPEGTTMKMSLVR